MANTTNGIYYPNDYNAAADVLADMKQMAESIDVKFGDVENNEAEIKQDISKIKAEQETQNEDISSIKEKDTNQDKLIEELQTQIIDLETENENIKNQIPTGEESGENITITDSSDMEFKELRIGGNSWQETRSGKNILKIDITPKTQTVNGVTCTINDDGSVTLNGTNTGESNLSIGLCNYGTLKLAANTTYKVTGKPGVSGVYLQVQYKKNGETTYASADNEFSTVEENISGLGTYVYIRFDVGVTVNNLTIYPMITLASETDLNYEQFGQMPSPEFPSEIRNVGDNVNEFDYTKVEQGGIDTTDGVTTSTSGYNVRTDFIPVKANTNYTFSYDLNGTDNHIIRILEYDQNHNYINYTLSNDKLVTIFKTQSTTRYLRITIYYDRLITPDTYTNYFKNIKFEKGSRSPYSPHNCGNANITVCNKNFFNASLIPFSCGVTVTDNGKTIIMPVANDGNGYVYTGKTLATLAPNLKVGDKAILRFIRNLGYTHNNKIYLQGIALTWTIDTEKTITQEMLDSIVALYGNAYTYGETGQCILTDFSIMLSSVTDTSWQPHQSQQFTFPLSEGQRMYKDSYLADDGVHHKRGRYVFKAVDHLSSYMNNLYGINQGGVKSVNGTDILSDRIIGDGNWKENTGYITGYGQTVVICGKPTDTVASFNERYEGTIIEYPLANEVIEPYTEEQQLVYNEIKKAHSYKNVTHIFSTDEIKPVLDVTYRKDLEIMFNNINTAIVSLGGV